MKSYTDIKQSKKLAEILPLESADMYYSNINTIYANVIKECDITWAKVLYGSYDIRSFDVCGDIPCWSLTALLDVIGNIFKYSLDYNGTSFTLIVGDFEITNETTVDVCYEMILKLHEFNLL